MFISLFITLLLLMNLNDPFPIPMPDINPNNMEFINYLKNFAGRLSAMERARQPYQGDWFQFNPSAFTYDSANTVNVATGLVLENLFSVGQRVELTQNDIIRHFFIIKVDSENQQLTLSGGNGDNVLINDDITQFATSNIRAPIRMGAYLSYTPDISADVGSPTFNDVNALYTMDGTVTTIIINAGIDNVNGSATQVIVGAPFDFDPDVACDTDVVIWNDSGATDVMHFMITRAVNDNAFTVMRKTFGFFPSSSFRLYATLAYTPLP